MRPVIYQGNCLDILALDGWSIGSIFADPPDNIGNAYDGYSDRIPDTEYFDFLESVILGSVPRCKTFWLSYYHRHDLKISRMIPFEWKWKKILWRFTFGQYVDGDHANGYRPILRIGEPGNVDNVRVPSKRMLLGDRRVAGYRVPDDVWEFSRVQGNAKQRRAWHPTQHPEELMQRIVHLSMECLEESWPPPLLDLFVGSGTTFRVGGVLGCEQSKLYSKTLSEEHGAEIVSGSQFVERIKKVSSFWSELDLSTSRPEPHL